MDLGAVGAGLVEGSFKMRFGGGACDLDVETVFVGLTTDGAGLEALEIDGGITQRSEESTQAAGTVWQLDHEGGAVVFGGGSILGVTEQIKLGDVGDISGDGEVQQGQAMTLGILPGADGGGTG